MRIVALLAELAPLVLLAITFWTLFSQGKLHVFQKWLEASSSSSKN
jgi:hypothetical protein